MNSKIKKYTMRLFPNGDGTFKRTEQYVLVSDDGVESEWEVIHHRIKIYDDGSYDVLSPNNQNEIMSELIRYI